MKKKKQNKISYKISVLLLLIIFISGCSMWGDFKTYFNTYYNADKLFTETEEEIKAEQENLFSFEDVKLPTKHYKNLEEVIKKTSSIFQFHLESSYFEDALLMTGKSFYLQQNYSRALRKFNELATVEDSDLLLENQMWIGKTQLKLREFEIGLNTLDEVKQKAIAEDEEEILTEVYISKISYLISKENFEEAVAEANELLTVDIDSELKAQIQYEIGLLHKENNNYKDALVAFANVEVYSPTFETEFNSKFEVAKMQKENGNVDESLVMFEDLLSRDKFSDSWGDIELEIGKIYFEREEIEDAFDVFTKVDTTYPKAEAGGEASFYRAGIVETHLNDYDSAMVLYKRTISSGATAEIRNKANKKSTLLNKYINFHKALDGYSLKTLYLTDENAFIRDSLDYMEKMGLDSLSVSGKDSSSTNVVQTNTSKNKTKSQIANKNKIVKPQRPKLSLDSLYALSSKKQFELGNLLFTEFDNPDSAFYYYETSLQTDDSTSNAAQIYFAMGNYFLLKENKTKADQMFQVVYDNYKDDPIMNEAAKKLGKPIFDFDKDVVEDDYLTAESQYDSLDFNGAINSFYKIYKENPKSKFAAKSLYTIGWIYENDLSNLDSAVSVYNTLTTKYRSSVFAKNVQTKLTGYKQEERRLQAIQDSIKKANEVKIDTTKIPDAIDTILPTDSTTTLPNTDSLLNRDSKTKIEKELLK
ncbi:MAG: tetratricopeptide repeat protein [Melioribacteraceae bacterium]